MKNTKKKTILQFLTLLLFLLPSSSYAMRQTTPNIITAKILATMNAGGYTYMQVEGADNKSEWVAIPESTVKKGTEVQFYQGMVMKNFTSKTLKRTFDTIIFSPGLVQSSATSPHNTTFYKTEDSFSSAVQAENTAIQTNRKNTSGGSLAAIVPLETTINVKKIDAENGYTVDEIFQNATQLDGREIAVRGKVVKFSPMIMGRNWIHLQDGTGNALKNRHDLVITTQEQAAEGDIVIARGILTANKDFGAGYNYEAIIEKATLKKE